MRNYVQPHGSIAAIITVDVGWARTYARRTDTVHRSVTRIAAALKKLEETLESISVHVCSWVLTKQLLKPSEKTAGRSQLQSQTILHTPFSRVLRHLHLLWYSFEARRRRSPP
jgi:hypothetical protein